MKRTILSLMMAVVLLLVGGAFMLIGRAQTESLAQIEATVPEAMASTVSWAPPADEPVIHLRAPVEGRYSLAQPAAETQRTVSVSGVGQVQAEPDQATVRLGVQSRAETAEQALSDNSTSMQSLLDALASAGIPAEAVQTQAVRLQPLYEEQPQPTEGGLQRTLTGYVAANIVEVTVAELDRLGELLDAAVEAGGNTIEGISFEVSDPMVQLDQARVAAIRDAQHKADALASLTNATLGEVLSINESSSAPQPMVRAESAMAQAASVPISAGSQTVEVNVQVTWLLE